jgi:hypothetical protein
MERTVLRGAGLLPICAALSIASGQVGLFLGPLALFVAVLVGFLAFGGRWFVADRLSHWLIRACAVVFIGGTALLFPALMLM